MEFQCAQRGLTAKQWGQQCVFLVLLDPIARRDPTLPQPVLQVLLVTPQDSLSSLSVSLVLKVTTVQGDQPSPYVQLALFASVG